MKRNVNSEIVLTGTDGTQAVIDVSGHSESHYLIDSRKQIFKEKASVEQWKWSDTMEMLLSLHVILEAGLNCIFRETALYTLKKQIDRLKVIENLDQIDFISKTILFIYNSQFDYQARLSDAEKYHSVIGKLKDFSAIRNLIIHGGANMTIYEDNAERHSKLRTKLLTDESLLTQVGSYVFISEGLNFYFDHLGDVSLKKRLAHLHQLIDYDFIPLSILERAKRIAEKANSSLTSQALDRAIKDYRNG